MPLVRIDLLEGREPSQVVQITDAIHEAIVAEYGIPRRDRFQIITEKKSGHIVAEDAGLGFERSSRVIIIQIFTQRGRSVEAKQRLYAAIASPLLELEIPGEDIFIGYVESSPEDWSFAHGRAQYMTGELSIPGSVG
jgi:phenylpyruvate tautomerase PptA (4-oxalocrotonate tautomerase family)